MFSKGVYLEYEKMAAEVDSMIDEVIAETLKDRRVIIGHDMLREMVINQCSVSDWGKGSEHFKMKYFFSKLPEKWPKLRAAGGTSPYGRWTPEDHWTCNDKVDSEIFTWLCVATRLRVQKHIIYNVCLYICTQ